MRFRKKPVEIEAVRLSPEFSDEEVLRFLDDCEGWQMEEEVPGAVLIPTLEGTMRARPGDWIIKGVEGEFYPCKPEIFEATYEKVAE